MPTDIVPYGSYISVKLGGRVSSKEQPAFAHLICKQPYQFKTWQWRTLVITVTTHFAPRQGENIVKWQSRCLTPTSV